MDGKRTPTQAEAGEILKRRRYVRKQSPREEQGFGPTSLNLITVFKALNARVPRPRLGNHIIFLEDEILQTLQVLVPQLETHHAEACHGVDRLRVASAQFDKHHVSHRKTVVLLRDSGDIHESGEVEDWVRLPKYKRIRKGKPPRLALTIFGRPKEIRQQQPTSTPSSKISGDSRDTNMDPTETMSQPTAPAHPTATDRPAAAEFPTEKSEESKLKVASGPPPTANHGPGFLKTNSDRAERNAIAPNHPRTSRCGKIRELPETRRGE